MRYETAEYYVFYKYGTNGEPDRRVVLFEQHLPKDVRPEVAEVFTRHGYMFSTHHVEPPKEGR